MLRSTLSSVKPSSLDEIDLSAKAIGTATKTTTSRTTTKVSRSMIAPSPAPSTSTSTSKSRTTVSLTSKSKQEKFDPLSSPLHDLFQIIHLSPPSAVAAGPSSSTSGSSSRGRPIESFSLHTVVDETGKWVKLRLYALVDVPLRVGGLRLEGVKEEGSGVVGGKRRRIAMEEDVKSDKGVRGSQVNPKEALGERKTIKTTSIISRTTTSSSKDVKLEEQDQSDTEDEIEPDPMDKREDHLDINQDDQGVEGGMDVELGVGVWKGYLRLSKVSLVGLMEDLARSFRWS
jgi:hypothetical protein